MVDLFLLDEQRDALYEVVAGHWSNESLAALSGILNLLDSISDDLHEKGVCHLVPDTGDEE